MEDEARNKFAIAIIHIFNYNCVIETFSSYFYVQWKSAHPNTQIRYLFLSWRIFMSKRHVIRFSLCTLLLLLLSACMVACGSSSASTSPKATTTAPTPSPTSSVTLTTYKGTGYIIGYPQGWTMSGSGQQVQISDAAQDNLLVQTETTTSNQVPPILSLCRSLCKAC